MTRMPGLRSLFWKIRRPNPDPAMVFLICFFSPVRSSVQHLQASPSTPAVSFFHGDDCDSAVAHTDTNFRFASCIRPAVSFKITNSVS
ncbi:uncharacterized protein LAESUDRAFT_752253 [Laetiporus sulphureus 93-53]|uniref:Uncharacterized protein n=1 Tax=Laetiporus sulphureus 93-53 TaxID=1314785 RepID=A0A165C8E3_9APHY|nr:uncharacterized protein LAESUDRAFT_752253 [Laetiporus sulphureus 93-53]KZT02379.1 hypothetical protein LAESUDRAFT_752253 [Laetiporus sulphureus 93-53]